MGEREQHLAEAILDALGDLDLALAGQKLYGAHFAHIHANGIGSAAKLAVDRGQCGGGLLGGFLKSPRAGGKTKVGRIAVDCGYAFMPLVDEISTSQCADLAVIG